jgi:hypothetical protein
MKFSPGTVVQCIWADRLSRLVEGRKYVVVSQKPSTGSVVVRHLNGKPIDGLYMWTRFRPVEKKA